MVAVLHRSGRMLVTLCLVAVAGVALLPSVARPVRPSRRGSAVGGGPTGNTLAWRVGYWAEIVSLANRNPVTGIGPNMTQLETDEAKKPHNDFLRAYVETGLAGLLAYLAMIGAILHTAPNASAARPPGSLGAGHRGRVRRLRGRVRRGQRRFQRHFQRGDPVVLSPFAAAASAVARGPPASEPVGARTGRPAGPTVNRHA